MFGLDILNNMTPSQENDISELMAEWDSGCCLYKYCRRCYELIKRMTHEELMKALVAYRHNKAQEDMNR
jgi:hypothetical protein